VPPHQRDEHDLGLVHDLKHIEAKRVARRRALALLGSAGAAGMLAACGGGGASAPATSATPPPAPPPPPPPPPPTSGGGQNGQCVQVAAETGGPFPADGTNSAPGGTSNVLPLSGVVRSDIRSNLIGAAVTAAGVQLTLTLTLMNVNNNCAALSGYAVYLWHTDRDGNYSLYDVPAQSYLRGVQVSNASGQVTFVTVFPGAYAGRYPHMHFEVFTSLASATSGQFARLTSQLAMPPATCSDVYANAAGYAASVARFNQSTIATDGIFRDNSAAQNAAMTPTITGSISGGLTGTATIGLVA
jgi:protocatechuate 3,4-dioxygenase beta subunit